MSYNDASQLISESYADGTLAGLLVTNQYDAYLRRTQDQGRNGATVLATATYAYELNSSRLQTVKRVRLLCYKSLAGRVL